jgi:hypothetical protein
MADNTQPKPDEEVDYVGELAAMKNTRKTLRRQITLTSNQIDTLANTSHSRFNNLSQRLTASSLTTSDRDPSIGR